MPIAPESLLVEARSIGVQRQRENEAAGRRDLLHTGKLSSAASHAIGAFGELVIEMVTGAPISKRSGGPSRSPDVCGLEVKTRWLKGSILVPVEDAGRYDSAQEIVLVHANPPHYEIVGWAYAGDFIGPNFKPNLNLPHPAFEIRPHQLRPWPPPRIRLPDTNTIEEEA